MQGDNVELAMRFFELLIQGEVDAALAAASEDFVLDRSRSNAPWRGIARGRAAARRDYLSFVKSTREVSEGPTWEVTDSRAVGPDLVALATRMRVRGRASGIDIDAHGGFLARVEGDRMAEAVLHQSFADGLLDARRRLLDRARLYFVCDAAPGKDLPSLVDAALRGGVDLVQLRDKELDDEGLIAAARAFRTAADEHEALFFLNDRPDLVDACDADGVHVGQDDMPVAEARRVAGGAALVGLSTHSAGQFDAALAAGDEARADQLSAGPVVETPTKPGRAAAGLELVRHAAAVAAEGTPWFAIGGIDAGNVAEVVGAGARRIVVVRAIRDAADPEAAARELRAALG